MAGIVDMADAVINALTSKTPASNRYTSSNTNARGNYDVSWVSSESAVLTPVAPRNERGAFANDRQRTYEFPLDLIVPYEHDTDSRDQLADGAQDVIDTIDAWPGLNGTAGVHEALASGNGDPVPVEDVDGTRFLIQPMTVMVIERLAVTEQE